MFNLWEVFQWPERAIEVDGSFLLETETQTFSLPPCQCFTSLRASAERQRSHGLQLNTEARKHAFTVGVMYLWLVASCGPRCAPLYWR